MRKIAVLFTLLFLLAVILPAQYCEAARLSKDQIIAVAEEAVEEGGVTLHGVNVIYDDGNTFWEERLAYIETDTSMNHGILPHGILKNKEYQVVYFDFVESSPMGDAWVFVDPDTGDVLAIYEERER